MRLTGFDYSQPGAYFITICTDKPVPLFERIQESQVQLNTLGNMIQAELRAIPTRHEHVQLDEHIIMPDHVHAILLLNLDNPVELPNQLHLLYLS